MSKIRYPSTSVKTNCVKCGIEFTIDVSEYRDRLNKTRRGIFCSMQCSGLGRKLSPEIIQKVIAGQKGISVPARGRIGHSVSPETREKIRQAKLGRSCRSDHDIILRELAHRGTPRYAITNGLIPDAIFIEDGKLVALEVEKERWETGIRKKMKTYDNRGDYDKVVLVWYSPEGQRLKEWYKENGEWSLFVRG